MIILNNIILKYNYFYFDFSSDKTGKKEFEQINSLISLKQIFGLKLGQDRFNLINRYLFNEQSLINLRSFSLEKLILYNEELSQWIYSKILCRTKLTSFRFDQIDQRFLSKQSSDLFPNLSYLVGYSFERFRQFSSLIPKKLTLLHMFF